MTCLEADALLLPFDILLSHVRRGFIPNAYIAIAVGSPVLFHLLIWWISHLEYKDLSVTSRSCWYMLTLMGKVFLYCEKMPPDFLYWRHLKHLPLILPLRFLYWRFHKRHEYPLRCLHLVLRKVIKILAFTKSVFKSFRTIFSITRLKTSPIPITLTPVCLSKTISLQVKNA